MSHFSPEGSPTPWFVDQTVYRPGALDALALPSLVNGTRAPRTRPASSISAIPANSSFHHRDDYRGPKK